MQEVKTVFFGPPYPGQLEDTLQPVRFTQPWFDCGTPPLHLNAWLLSAAAPVIDILPRYCPDIRLRRPVYSAVAAMDTFLIKIPINLCPISEGNPAPNLLAGSDMCHHPSTVCEPLMKKGSQFLPVTFQCRCKAGMRPPMYQKGWYNGPMMAAKATQDEYRDGFKCLPIGNLMSWPGVAGLHYIGPSERRVPFARKRRAVEEAVAYFEQAKVLQEVEEELKKESEKRKKLVNKFLFSFLSLYYEK